MEEANGIIFREKPTLFIPIGTPLGDARAYILILLRRSLDYRHITAIYTKRSPRTRDRGSNPKGVDYYLN
jgi:hypothetical protein